MAVVINTRASGRYSKPHILSVTLATEINSISKPACEEGASLKLVHRQGTEAESMSAALWLQRWRGDGARRQPQLSSLVLAQCHCNRQRDRAAPLGSWEQYVLNNYYLWYSVYLNSLTPSKIPGNNYGHYFLDEEIETQDIKWFALTQSIKDWLGVFLFVCLLLWH